MLSSLSPESRKKLEATFGPIFAGETGEMFTQVLELFKSTMLNNYRLVMYRQEKVAAHNAIGLEAEMLAKDLKVALEGVREAGRVRLEYEKLGNLDKLERTLGRLIVTAKYHTYVEALMKANGISDQRVIEAAKTLAPLLPEEVDGDSKDEPQVIIIDQESPGNHYDGDSTGFVYKSPHSHWHPNGSSAKTSRTKVRINRN
jgi:hypothetical protein